MTSFLPNGRALTTSAALSIAALLTTACTHDVDMARQRCASPEAAKSLMKIALAGSEVPEGEVALTLDATVLDSYDKSTERATCAATFKPYVASQAGSGDGAGEIDKLANSGAIVNGVSVLAASSALSKRQSFTVQPSAEGGGLVYTLGGDASLALKTFAIAYHLMATQRPTAEEEKVLQNARELCNTHGTEDHVQSFGEQVELAQQQIDLFEKVRSVALNSTDQHCLTGARDTLREQEKNESSLSASADQS